MADIKSGNWSFRDPGKDIPDGSVIYGGNFSQLAPGTVILAGKKLTIRGGNWVNVKRDPLWIVEGGNWAQISRCSHVHPEWVARGLSPCAEDCEHRVGDEKQWVDIDEGEYRETRNSLDVNRPAVKTIDTTDADGIVSQRLQKQVYIYTDRAPSREAR